MALIGRREAVAVALMASLAAAGGVTSQQNQLADTVLLNGKILTVDEGDRIAQAVAIAGGRIVAVGTDDQIRARIGPSTEQIDLRGRAATPGLLDAHAHFNNGGAQRLFVLDLSFPSSKASRTWAAACASRPRSSPPARGSKGAGGTRASSTSAAW